MSGLTGTYWTRRSDDVQIRIEGDSEGASGRSNRFLRAINIATRRSFWVTPEGLSRKYRRDDSQPARRKCSHPWQHTVYGASNPARNGTTCVICGEADR